jgi:hypothetical protein
MGRDDAERAAIEHALHLVNTRYADQRSHLHLKRRHADLAGGLEGKARMLHIDIEAVEARRLGDAGDLDAVDEAHRHGGRNLAAGELLLQTVA